MPPLGSRVQSDVDYYHLVTTATKDRSIYPSLQEAEAALKAQLQLQLARGCENERNPSGRYMSKCADAALVMF